MKVRPWMSAAAAATMALGLFCIGPSPAAAEDLIQNTQVSNDWGSFRYKLFQYPGRNNGFFMMPKSYVTFDVVNGKFWQIEHPRAEYEIKPGGNPEHVFPPIAQVQSPIRYERLSVTFFTPDMKSLGHFDQARIRHTYSVPRDGNDYERLIVRIESDCEDNIDIKMRVWDAVDAVMSEPIPGERYRY